MVVHRPKDTANNSTPWDADNAAVARERRG